MPQPSSTAAPSRGTRLLDRLADQAAAGTALLALVTLGRPLADRWWVAELTTHFVPQYLPLALLALVVLLLRGRRRWALVAGLLVLVHGVSLLPQYLPADRRPPVTGRTVRLLHLNLWSANGHRPAVVALLGRLDPDVLSLQEVTPEWEEALAPLAGRYRLRRTAARTDNFGIALWTKLPLTTAEKVYVGPAGLPSIVARGLVDGRALTLASTHPICSVDRHLAAWRDAQLTALAGARATWDPTAILLGDLNVTPWSPRFGALLAGSGLLDVRDGRGILPTWPAQFPPGMRIPIDHCLVSPDVAVLDVKVLESVGSDHLPLLVTLRLP